MTVYEFKDLQLGRFIERPNRYLSKVEVDGRIETVHVHDPGRLKELLYEGNEVLVRYCPSPTRKTSWDMIAAKKEDEYVLVHSGIHRYISTAILENPELNPFGPMSDLKAEVKVGQSRIDYYGVIIGEAPIWIEVKGCSLSIDGTAMFPDAPTVRGARHLEELISLKQQGKRAGVLILVLSEATQFSPKWDTDPVFADIFYKALEVGVEIHPVRVSLLPSGEMRYLGEIPILERG